MPKSRAVLAIIALGNSARDMANDFTPQLRAALKGFTFKSTTAAGLTATSADLTDAEKQLVTLAKGHAAIVTGAEQAAASEAQAAAMTELSSILVVGMGGDAAEGGDAFDSEAAGSAEGLAEDTF